MVHKKQQHTYTIGKARISRDTCAMEIALEQRLACWHVSVRVQTMSRVKEFSYVCALAVHIYRHYVFCVIYMCYVYYTWNRANKNTRAIAVRNRFG